MPTYLLNPLEMFEDVHLLIFQLVWFGAFEEVARVECHVFSVIVLIDSGVFCNALRFFINCKKTSP